MRNIRVLTCEALQPRSCACILFFFEGFVHLREVPLDELVSSIALDTAQTSHSKPGFIPLALSHEVSRTLWEDEDREQGEGKGHANPDNDSPRGGRFLNLANAQVAAV